MSMGLNWISVAEKLCRMLENKPAKLRIDSDRSSLEDEIFVICTYTHIGQEVEVQAKNELPDDFLLCLREIEKPIQMTYTSRIFLAFEEVLFREIDIFLSQGSPEYPKAFCRLAYRDEATNVLARNLKLFFTRKKSFDDFCVGLGVKVFLDGHPNPAEIYHGNLELPEILPLKHILSPERLVELANMAEEVIRQADNHPISFRTFF